LVAKRTFSASARKTPSPPGSARAAALSLLARRDYTSAELSERLIDRGHTVEDVADALKNLIADGSVNDARVAAAHVRTSTRVKGRGRLRVKGELLARGLSRQAIDEALSALETGDERDALVRILKRKRYPERPTLTERQRMYQHLLRRGFPGDLIRSVLGRGSRSFDDDAS
jgi:regulatory protein